MVVVNLTEEEPIWIGRKMDSIGAKFTAFLAERCQSALKFLQAE